MTASKNAGLAGEGGNSNADGDYQLVPHEMLCSSTATYEVVFFIVLLIWNFQFMM